MTTVFRGGGEPRSRQTLGPHATQQGAATPGQEATAQGAVPAAGNVAEPQSGPTAHRVGPPPPRPIRFLAATDGTPIGLLALAYLKAFLRIGLQVRVGSISGVVEDKWSPYSPLLATPMPMPGAFVNVVCCDPFRWAWEQRVPMPKRLPSGELQLPGEVAVGIQELYTASVWNVLITNEYHDVRIGHDQMLSAAKYDAIVVPNELCRLFWAARRRVGPHLIPTPVSDANLRVLHSLLT